MPSHHSGSQGGKRTSRNCDRGPRSPVVAERRRTDTDRTNREWASSSVGRAEHRAAARTRGIGSFTGPGDAKSRRSRRRLFTCSILVSWSERDAGNTSRGRAIFQQGGLSVGGDVPLPVTRQRAVKRRKRAKPRSWSRTPSPSPASTFLNSKIPE